MIFCNDYLYTFVSIYWKSLLPKPIISCSNTWVIVNNLADYNRRLNGKNKSAPISIRVISLVAK